VKKKERRMLDRNMVKQMRKKKLNGDRKDHIIQQIPMREKTMQE
jgi:hypothetical protein